MKYSKKGQVLVEWCIVSVVLLLVWSGMYRLGKTTLNQTIADVWSVNLARKNLSRVPTRALPSGLKTRSFGSAVFAQIDKQQHFFKITVPQKKRKEGWSVWRWFSSGFL